MTGVAIPRPPETDDRLRPRHVGLIAMLCFICMCEGFDISLTSVVLPYAGKEFHADASAIGNALGVIALGSIAAWLLIRLADRFGRRPVLIVASTGFSLGSLATTLATDIHQYVAIQTVTRLLLVTQVALAYLVLSESLPARLRGRTNGVLGASGSVGAALPFLFLGAALASPIGWRALFLIGAAPLIAVPFLLFRLRETPVYLAARHAGATRLSARAEFRALTGPALRGRFVAMGALWFVLNFASSVSSLFFTLYVVQERHWTAGDLVHLSPALLAAALVGYLASGVMMDLLGRRVAMTVFLLLIGGLTQLCYATTGWWTIAAAWIGIQATLGVWVAAFTINAELFPTHLRAAANGWCNSLIGRWGVVIAPVVMGALGRHLGGIAPAATLLGFVAYVGVPLIWLAIPETRAAPLDAAGPD